ncbi:MAG TPA: carboxypeptidase regulatory-like domain-containing protein [Candidatus Dormibacteraeota bacterium]|nr:carboxypeptidase regulatory-like domain-containing protein [Candidatus Dormibacteraeota bacterium]
MVRLKHSICVCIAARVVLVFVLGLFFTANAGAQVVGGTIQGTVTDPNGNAIPDAQVEIVNTATQIVTSLKSNADGFYSAPNLLPGEYKITATRTGFSKIEAEVTLTVGAQRVVNLAMHIGTVAETIKVTTEAPDVELASSEISNVVNATTIRELPLNGRDWTQLATLEPGISKIRTQPGVGQGDRGQRGFGTQMTVNGGRPAQNNYRLDGISVNDYSNSAPGSVLGADLGSDAVAEFSVLSSNYPAEYGRSSGGVINAITRSGTNGFHGSVYEFLRNSALDAKNYFDLPDRPIPAFKRNQFGATAGGPIWKDHTFIFGNYEGLRQSLGLSEPAIVPTASAKQTSDPVLAKYLAIWPLPNAGLIDANTGKFIYSRQQVTPENYFTTRVDHRISASDSLYGTYMRDSATISQPDELGVKVTGFTTGRQLVTIEENHIFTPQVINAVRVGYSRVVGLVGQTLKGLSPVATDPSYGFAAPGRPVGEIDIGGLTNFTGGLGAISNYNFHWNSYQFYDDAFVNKGKHSIKFGVAVERIQENMSAADSPNGVYIFSSLPAFLQNQPKSYAANLGETGKPRYMRQTVFGVYLADDLRLYPNLTLNLGLRYEMATVPSEKHGKIATLINLSDATLHTGDPYFANPTLRNFEPRFGFSWDPFKTGTTAIRGGFGVFDVLPLPYQTQNLTLFAAPFYLLGTSGSPAQGSFPNGFSGLGASSLRVNYIQPHPHRNYVMEWNLTVQRQLTSSLAVMLGYTGSRGVHQPFRIEDMNIPRPDIAMPNTPVGYVWTQAVQGQFVAPNFGQVEGLLWNASSIYHAMEMQVKKNMSHGLQAQASFTWGRSIDTSSAGSIGDGFHNSISSLPFFDTRLNRGPSDFNITRNLVLNFEWEIPSPKTSFAPAQWALGGWQLGGIFEASSGLPFSVIITGDPLALGNTDPFGRPDRLGLPGCSNPVNPGHIQYVKLECFALPAALPSIAAVCQPYAYLADDGITHVPIPGTCLNRLGNSGRNNLTGPGVTNLDMSLFKNIKVKKISENFNIQFRAETFNILNHPNFAPPVDFNILFDSTPVKDPKTLRVSPAGILTQTQTTSRQLQVALKLSW